MLSPFDSSEKLSPLPDISEAIPLSESDLPMVREIADVLRRHGAISRFGLTLLHQHFDTDTDEALVESTNVAMRTQTIQPCKKSELGELPLVETAWRLDSGQPVMACVCVILGKGNHQHLPRG